MGGLWLRARAGPVRERLLGALLAGLAARGLPVRRIHPDTPDGALAGGLDLAATLAAGRPVMAPGLLEPPGAIILAMAERCPPGLAARLGAALDRGGICLVALDEGAGPDEGLPSALTDRLGLFVDLEGVAWSDTDPLPPPAPIPDGPAPALPPRAARALATAAAELGIESLRAPLLALAAARAAARLRGDGRVGAGDLALAAAMVLAHRALPVAEAPPAPPPPPDPGQERDRTDREPESETQDIPAEMLIEAARAALPEGLIAALAAGRAGRAARGARGTGAARKGNRRGRPLPSRPGRPGGGARIDLVATLRAAAPWQTIRRRSQPEAPGVRVRMSDIRIRRFEERSDRVLIFAVDASGSAAVARLAEAKGAVELLLGQAYARRDHVALVSFRGTGAEVMLPPTRSLVQTKRRLQGLPGGGGTPLAAGLRTALGLATLARAKGMTPTIALLTDGRANIALDGRADRAQAGADAERMAAAIAAEGVPAVVIDTGARPSVALAALAQRMGARAAVLPRADARAVSALIAAAPG